MAKLVLCAKLNRELPALPYKPFDNELGRRILDQISAEAWKLWIEHSKMVVNENRLDLTTAEAHKILLEQCEQFLFSDDDQAPPPDFKPPTPS